MKRKIKWDKGKITFFCGERSISVNYMYVKRDHPRIELCDDGGVKGWECFLNKQKSSLTTFFKYAKESGLPVTYKKPDLIENTVYMGNEGQIMLFTGKTDTNVISISTEVNDDRIYLITPNGDVIDLNVKIKSLVSTSELRGNLKMLSDTKELGLFKVLLGERDAKICPFSLNVIVNRIKFGRS